MLTFVAMLVWWYRHATWKAGVWAGQSLRSHRATHPAPVYFVSPWVFISASHRPGFHNRRVEGACGIVRQKPTARLGQRGSSSSLQGVDTKSYLLHDAYLFDGAVSESSGVVYCNK